MVTKLTHWLRHRRTNTIFLTAIAVFFVVAFYARPLFGQSPGAEGPAAASGGEHAFRFFALFSDPKYSHLEVIALFVVLGIAICGLLYALMLAKQVKAADQGTPRMQGIAAAVREGADAYLAAQFRKIGPLILIITVILYFTTQSDLGAFKFGRAGAFALGAVFSWLVGFVGMRLATTGNLRVAAAARRSYGEAMQLGYRTGTVTGMLTDGLGLLGGTLIFIAYGEQAYEALLGFGFGGTLLALFMRVGGGIYTKAADVGADLVGKIEKNIPEDDPRNAATIADNVGDNVGDCAGMAADIFESYEVTIVAAMILGLATFGHKGVIFPLLVRGIGVLGSIISTYTVKAGPNDTSDTALKSVHNGFWIGSIISVIGFILLGLGYLKFDAAYLAKNAAVAAGFPNGDPTQLPVWANFGVAGLDMRPVITCFIGVILAIGLNKVTSYYTHTSHAPVKGLAKACQTGHATNIIQGFAVGYESTVAMVLVIAVAILLSYLCYTGTPPLFVAYGVAMTGIGMLTLTGNTISMDVFGAVPFLFSSMLIRAVGRAAFLIVKECREQFRDADIWTGKKKPNYGRVVDICTSTAQKELIGPGFLAILTPIAVGFLLGTQALGGFLAGMILTGQLLAVFMANAGGAWDNAKKLIEDGNYGGKGSEAHKAAVTGDTVGDPLKDTAGPAINPLIKVMNMVSLLALGLVIKYNVITGTASRVVGLLVALLCAGAIGWSIWQSKRESKELREMEKQFEQ